MLRSLFISLGILLCLSSFAQPQPEVNGVVFEEEELMIFIKSRPKEKYRILGQGGAAKVLPSYKQSIMVPHVIKRIKKEYPKADGLIFLDGSNLTKVDIIQFYDSPRAQRRINRKDPPKMNPANKVSVVQQEDGINLFISSRPQSRFDNLGTIYCPKGFKGQKEDDRIKAMVEEAKKNYKDFDGLIFNQGGDLCKAFVIKLRPE